MIGIKEKFNAFIQGQSKIKLKVNATGVYGSKIASYEVKLMGLTYNKSEFIFDATQGGEVMIQTSVVDTRGKGKTSTQTINIAEYVTPTIELFDVKRCDNLGVENPQENFMSARIKFNITTLNNLNEQVVQVGISRTRRDDMDNFVAREMKMFTTTHMFIRPQFLNQQKHIPCD